MHLWFYIVVCRSTFLISDVLVEIHSHELNSSRRVMKKSVQLTSYVTAVFSNPQNGGTLLYQKTYYFMFLKCVGGVICH